MQRKVEKSKGISTRHKPFVRIKNTTTGITLVALVVTIVVLLILAGITITMLFSDNGIIKKAQEAADKTADDKVNTEEGINNLTDQMNVALGEAPKLNKKGTLVPVKTKYAQYTDDTGSAPIPGGYCVVKDATINGTLKENKVGTGLVISDVANDDLDNTAHGNQFVWVPVNSSQLERMYGTTGTGANAKKFGKLYEFGSSTWNSSTNSYDWTIYSEPQALNWDENGIKLTSGEGSNREPEIIASYDGSDANYSTYFKKAISETMTKAEFQTQLENEFERMIASVEKYDGFYIGRYETGSWSSTNNANIPKVQKGQTVGISGANWYYQYMETKNLGKIKDTSDKYVDNPNVETNMIWGCQFDRTLEWIAETNLTEEGKPNYALLIDPSRWGNYTDYAEKSGDNSTEGAGIEVLPSGTNQNWQKNNIFDLAGNAFDWTIEKDNEFERIMRGGSCNFSSSDFPASSRLYDFPGSDDVCYSSRSTLYIK